MEKGLYDLNFITEEHKLDTLPSPIDGRWQLLSCKGQKSDLLYFGQSLSEKYGFTFKDSVITFGDNLLHFEFYKSNIKFYANNNSHRNFRTEDSCTYKGIFRVSLLNNVNYLYIPRAVSYDQYFYHYERGFYNILNDNLTFRELDKNGKLVTEFILKRIY